MTHYYCMQQTMRVGSAALVCLQGLVCGKPVNATNNQGNGCDLEGIANPDNLSYMPGETPTHSPLLIGTALPSWVAAC